MHPVLPHIPPLISAFLLHTLSMGVSIVSGTFLNHLLHLFPANNRTDISRSLSTHLACVLFSNFLATKLIQIFGYRFTGILGSLLYSAGYFSTAYSLSSPHLILVVLTYGVVAGTGSGLLFATSLYYTVRTFPQSLQNVAIGSISLGVSLGSIGSPLFIQGIIREYGVIVTMQIMSGIFLIALPCSLTFTPRHIPVTDSEEQINNLKYATARTMISPFGMCLNIEYYDIQDHMDLSQAEIEQRIGEMKGRDEGFSFAHFLRRYTLTGDVERRCQSLPPSCDRKSKTDTQTHTGSKAPTPEPAVDGDSTCEVEKTKSKPIAICDLIKQPAFVLIVLSRAIYQAGITTFYIFINDFTSSSLTLYEQPFPVLSAVAISGVLAKFSVFLLDIRAIRRRMSAAAVYFSISFIGSFSLLLISAATTFYPLDTAPSLTNLTAHNASQVVRDVTQHDSSRYFYIMATSGAVGFAHALRNGSVVQVLLLMFGAHTLHASNSISLVFSGIASLAGPELANLMQSVTGKYEMTFLTSSGLTMLGAISVTVAWILVKCDDRKVASANRK